MSLLGFFFVLFSIFYIYQPVLVKTFALICLYSLDLAILVVPRNMTHLAFNIFPVSYLLDVKNFPQKSMLIPHSNVSMSNSNIFLGITSEGISVGLRWRPIKWINISWDSLLIAYIPFLFMFLEIESCSDIVFGIV